ncbi:MAG TPA: bifunctional 3-(3-hydroxy-phenyl)propionate/3-hydroxycinnamic acid hydroxylase [Dehalococcoidia bacterium]
MYDVLIVGYGPTGMLAAILLGRAGHRVAVIERYTTLYNLPRVGIVHDDVMRMFQDVGCLERVQPAMLFLPAYEMARNGKILMSSKIEPLATHGWPEFISVYQPAFETELDVLARADPNIEVLQGETAVSVSQDRDGVEVTTKRAGSRRTVRGRYLIGADGGNSFVRRALGIEYISFGFDQDWLVIDAKALRPQRPDLPMYRQFLEPELPHMTMRIGPDHRRWSFMLLPGEDVEEATRIDNIWRRLDRPEGGTPDEFEIIRAVSYRFQSLVAGRWRDGRIFLAGDAAHQMPPFLAQGLCSGFRDAYNLAWKLDLVLKGVSTPSFLDTYVEEREPNSRATIIESARVGENVIERDPEKARLRDERLLALQAQMQQNGNRQLIAFRVPGYEAGFIARNAIAAGAAFGQRQVRRNGVEGPFDDVAGRGFLILARNGEPASVLSNEDAAFWRSLGGAILRLDLNLEDVTGYYTGLMDEYGCDVIVKRPDFYIFGAASTLDGLPALIADLRLQLTS